MKALRKDFYIEIKKTLNRFLSIFFIVALGVAFYAGIRSTEPDMKLSGDLLYDESNLMDIRILSTLGLTEEDLNAILGVEGVSEAYGSYTADFISFKDSNQYVVKVFSSLGSMSNDTEVPGLMSNDTNMLQLMNKVTVKEGNAPKYPDECLIDARYLELTGLKIGDKIKLKSGNESKLTDTLKYDEFTITGSGTTPYYLARSQGNSSIGNGTVAGFLMLHEDAFTLDVYTEIYITVSGARELTSYSDAYQNKVDEVTERIKNQIQDARVEAYYLEIMDDANEVLNEAKEELKDAETKAEEELKEAWQKIEEAEQEIKDGKAEIENNEKKIEDGYKELEDFGKLLTDGKQQLEIGKSELAASKAVYETGKTTYEEGLEKYKNGIAELNQGKDELTQAEASLSYIEDPASLELANETIKYQREELEKAEASLAATNQILTETKNSLDSAVESIKAGEDKINQSEQEIKENEKKIEDARAELKKGEIELAKAKADIAKGEEELNQGKSDYTEAKDEADIKIADARKEIAEAEEEIGKIKKPQWYVLDRNYLQSNAEFGQDAERIGAIGTVFPVIFFLVAALVSLTTMTRMVEEQRTQIGTLKSLGYSKISIASKYIVYAFLATLSGSIFGGIIGSKVIPTVVINAYKVMYVNLDTIVVKINWFYFVSASVIAVVCVGAATIFACYKELAASPAELMRPAAPKQGKRVFLEKITFIWNRLNFTWKSTIRNLIRYKKRFFMTVFGVGGCMALLLVGFGLKDSIFSIVDLQYNSIRIYDGLITLENDASEEEILEVENFIKEQNIIEQDMFVYEASVQVYAEGLEKDAHLTIPEELDSVSDYFVLRDRISDERYQLSDTGVIISEKLAKLLNVKAGDLITMEDKDSVRVEATIDAVSENYVMHYVFMSPALFNTLYQKEVEFNQIAYKAPHLASDMEELMAEQILLLKGVSNHTFMKQTAKSFEESMGNFDVVIWVLIISAGGLAFVVLYNLNNINITERKRELATLKVLGFYDMEVSEYVFRENIILTGIGILVGVILGIFLHRYVIITAEIDLVMFGRNIGMFSFIKSILLTILFSSLINFSMYFKLKKVDMTSSLKSVE